MDLSLQQKQRLVTLFTKDGIPLQTEVRVYFQVHPGGHKPTSGDMFPFLEQAVMNAVYSVSDWKEHTLQAVIGSLRPMIAGRYLYEIYDPLKKWTPEKEKPSTEVQVIRDELLDCINQMAFDWGVRISNLEIDIKPPSEIEDQALAFERTRMEQQIQIENARAENTRIKEFMADTGGTVEDYALLHLCENYAGTGAIPPSLDQLLSDAFERASVRTSRKKEKKADQAS